MKKRKQQQKCKRRKHLEPQMKFQSNRQLTTDDITVKQTNKSRLSIIKFQNESQMQ